MVSLTQSRTTVFMVISVIGSQPAVPSIGQIIRKTRMQIIMEIRYFARTETISKPVSKLTKGLDGRCKRCMS